MLGSVFYFLHITIIRNFFLLMVLGVVLYFTSDYKLIEQLTFQNINNLEDFINDYLNSSNFQYFYTIAISLIVSLNIFNIFEILLFYNEISLPYSLNLVHSIPNLNREVGIKNVLDKFSFFSLLFSNGEKLTYTNRISIDKSRYEDNIEQIREYFRVPKDSEILFNQTNKKTIEISINNISKEVQLDINKIIKDKIYLGETFNKEDLYLDIDKLTHILTVGESGSGKSTLINCMLLSILKNLNLCEKLFLVDFKGVELYRYSKIDKVNFIDKVEDLISMLEDLTTLMNERYERLKEIGELKHNGDYVFVVLEEVGSISTFQDTKIKNQIFNLLINLLQKARAANIYFLVFAQKLDISVLPSTITTNIQGKILLKTDTDYNQHQTIGTKEVISQYTNIDPGKFNRGRGLFKDGISSEVKLFQSPIFDKDIYKEFI